MAPIRAYLYEPPDVLVVLAPQITFDLHVLVDISSYRPNFALGQVPDLRVPVDAGLAHYLPRRRMPDAEYVRQPDLDPLFPRGGLPPLSAPYYPCLCLCRGFVQITRTTPRRFITLHRSHIGFTLARTFITRLLAPLRVSFSYR